MHRIDRPFVQVEATVGRLEQLWEWHETQKEQEKLEVKEPEPLVNRRA
jgi:hypothetical protein